MDLLSLFFSFPLPFLGILPAVGAIGALAGSAGAGLAAGGGAAAGGGIMSAIAPSLISGGLGLFGGLLGNKAQSNNISDQLKFRREELHNAIQWRVQDAQQAGIHPLYALGMSPPSSFPIALDDKVGPAIQEMGQNVGNVLHRQMDQDARDKHQLDMALGHASLAESDARREMYLSEAAKNRQVPAAPMPGVGLQLESSGQDMSAPGVIEVKPPEVASSKQGFPNIEAGVHPGYQEVWQGLQKKMPMMLPSLKGENQEEVIKEMWPGTWWALLKANSELYGDGWLKDFLRLRYMGENPLKNWSDIINSARPKGSATLAPDLYRQFNNAREEYALGPLRSGYDKFRKEREDKVFTPIRKGWEDFKYNLDRFFNPLTFQPRPRRR